MSNSTNVSARQRIASLLDDSSFVEVGSYVTSRSTNFNVSNQENPADGVVTGTKSMKLAVYRSHPVATICVVLSPHCSVRQHNIQ